MACFRRISSAETEEGYAAGVVVPESSDRVFTIPNLVTLVRLAMVPVFWWVLLAEDNVTLAAVLILLIGGTDWVDGYLARRLDQASRLGAAFDPIADRLMIGSAVVAGLIAGVVPATIGWALIAREVAAGVVALVLLTKASEVLKVRYLGKVATFILYGAIPLFYLAAAGVLEAVVTPVAWTAGVTGLALYWTVALLYVGDARRRLAEVKSEASRQEG